MTVLTTSAGLLTVVVTRPVTSAHDSCGHRASEDSKFASVGSTHEAVTAAGEWMWKQLHRRMHAEP